MATFKNILKKIINFNIKNGNRWLLFKSKEEVKNFMEKELNCNAYEVSKYYLLKAVLFASKSYNKGKLFDPQLNELTIIRSIYYHTWFTKGQIKKRRCIIINNLG